MTLRLDISIGPVQGFVTQSRRTRDLWASSYLLSALSAHAMYGAAKAGGKIVQPVIERDPLYLRVSGCGNVAPKFGTLPNHFVVRVDGGQERAKAVAHASVQAFNAAWERVCKAVWDKYLVSVHELGNGTETIWNRQVGSFWEVMWTVGEPGALARRKHWRRHQPPPEPGDKCVLNHDLQELSGYLRNRDIDAQNEFWSSLGLSELELRENERLSAIALVKRLFPLVSQEALGWQVAAKHWPSTLDIGAGATEEDQPPFYAIVLADGDRLGKLLASMDTENVSNCLAAFTCRVPGIVEQHKGCLIYAGGDDVLAMMPVERALACAQAIATAYGDAFARTEASAQATLSAATVFAHGKLPLGQVLRETHRQLDVYAKNENGRDSLSVVVLKNSGAYCQWTTSWNRASFHGSTSESAISQVNELSALLKASGNESGLSSTLIYRLRSLISRFCGWNRWEPGTWAELADDVDLRAFLNAEIAHSFSTKTGPDALSPSNAADAVWQLLSRSRSETPALATITEEIGVDALMLAHFLANPTDIQ